jgi:hypothetical protein
MKTKSFLIFALVLAILTGCKKSNEDTNTGIVKGVIKNSTTSATISNARVFVFDASTNAPAANSNLTGSGGTYSFSLEHGSYYIKVAKLGFEALPPQGVPAVPFEVTLDQTVTMDFEMTPLTATDLGTISGKVTESSAAAPGILVIASGTTNGYSSITDKNGNFWIYNIPAGTYTLQAWKSGYTSSSVNITLAASGNSQNNALSLTAGVTGSVTGSVTFLATTNIEVDVSLVNPLTKEIIPGLVTTTSSGNYTISNVPAGTYIARASYVNDGKVMDPDWILKNGEPTVTVTTSAVTMNFSLTGAVEITSPTNSSGSLTPVEVNTLTPTFTWQTYSGTDNYVIEVDDINGNAIWGGISSNGTVRNIVIPKTTTSIDYNSDGNAIKALENGHIYRWRVYSSKNDNSDPRTWKINSVSEDQMGIFKVVL